MSYLAFPYRIGVDGATATGDLAAYIADLVRLVLETDPGERVNRPNFGGGLKQLIFAGMDAQMLAAAETLLRGALLQWLGDAITIETLTITSRESGAVITLRYVVTHTQQAVTQTIHQGLPP